MKIYNVEKNWIVKEWKVVEVEAEEKSKSYILKNRVVAFGFRTKILKGQAHLTPFAAITAKLNDQKQILKKVASETIEAKNNIAQLENLRDEIIRQSLE